MSDSSLPDPNPYAAPQSESMLPNDLPHFGLSEPICLEGVKTVDDLLLARVTIYGKRRWWQHVITVGWLVIISLLPLTILTQSIPAGYLINLFAATAAPSLYLLCVFVLVPQFKRRQLERLHGKGEAERYYLGEESLTRITASSTGEFRWERFACYRDAGLLLVLRLPEHQNDYVIPRSYCPSDALWEVVQDLIACKLPLWEQGQPEPGPQQIEPLVTPATVLDDTSADSGAIEAIGQCTPRQWRQAQRLVRPFWFLRYLYATLLMTGLVIWGLVKLKREQPSWTNLLTFALLALVLVAKFGADRWSIYKSWQDKRGPFEVQNWSLSAERLKLTTVTTDQTTGWNQFEKVIIRRHMVLLVSPNRTFCLLPRSFFASDKAWQQFLQIVGQKTAS